jgi:hypothetical protein
MHGQRLKQIIKALTKLPAFRPLLKNAEGRSLLNAAASSMVERTIAKGTVVVRQV